MCGENICKGISGKRIISFDYIRIFCTFWIAFIWHIKAYVNNNDFIHMTSTDLMFQITYGVLCVFSFISGFFNVSSINSKHDFVRYMVKRLEKLYPIYMLSCISLYTIGDLSLKQCILSLTLVGGMIARPYPGTIWFVAMIIFFNFLTQIIALSKRHRKVTLIVCIELALVLLSACRMIDLRLAYYFPSYVLGMLIRSAVDDGCFFEINFYYNNLSLCLQRYWKGVNHSFMHDIFGSSFSFVIGRSIFDKNNKILAVIKSNHSFKRVNNEYLFIPSPDISNGGKSVRKKTDCDYRMFCCLSDSSGNVLLFSMGLQHFI